MNFPRSRPLRLAAGILLLACTSVFTTRPAAAGVNNTPVDPAAFSRQVRVACVGDSITAGFGVGSTADYYPAQLTGMLGSKWTVLNFGRSGSTCLKKGSNPYYNSPEYLSALDSNPDVVVIMLGANDSTPTNWTYNSEFKEDFRFLIRQFAALPGHPRIFACQPCFAAASNSYNISETNLQTIRVWVNQLADEESTGLIDNLAVTQPYPSDQPDGVHPNARGASRLAENAFHLLTGNPFPANVAVKPTTTRVTLNWFTHGASTPYTVARSTVPGGPYTTVSANNTAGTFADPNVAVNNAYYYSLTTTNIYGTTATSPEIAVPLTADSGFASRVSGGIPAASSEASGKTAAQAFDNDDATDWTTASTSQTGWVQYVYDSRYTWAITSYRLESSSAPAASDPQSWQLLGSNDGSTWTTLDSQSGQTFTARRQEKRYDFTNTLPFRFYRLNVTATAGGEGSGIALAEFRLWNADTDPVATADAESTGQTAAQAFDGRTDTKWYNNVNGGTGFLRYQYGGGAARTLSAYALTSANDVPERDPKAWQFQGSNDGATWTTLDTRATETFANRYQVNSYPLTATQPYRFYQLKILANSGGSGYGLQLAELTFTPAVPAPSAPGTPTITFSNGVPTLTWTAGAGAGGYTVQRATSPTGPFTTIAAGVPNLSYTDSTAVAGVTYYYRVVATNSGGASPASATATNANQPAPPAAPIGVSAAGKNLGVEVAWTPSPGASGYTVRRAAWNGGPTTLVAAGSSATTFTDNGLLNGTRYFYTVSATGPGGESAPSIEVSAVPQATATAQTLPFLHPLFATNAVLQRDALVPVWGWTTPGAQVSVSIHGQTSVATAASTGRWQVAVGPFAADGVAYSLSVTGPQSVTVSNLVFGDVFLFSGQSNMERQLGPRGGQQDIYNYQAEAAAANYPNIRSFYVPEAINSLPQGSLNASWSVCNPTNVLNITAVGFFTTRALHLAETVPGPNNTVVNVPMGILHTAYGGTRIDPWLETNEAAAFPEFAASVNRSTENPTTDTPSALFNQMISPMAPFRVKGAVWYQGESSTDRAAQYRRLLPALMSGWRRVFGQPTMPFVVVQLPNWGGATNWPDLREAQLGSVLADPYSRLSTGTDIGETNDIHPRDKQDVGTRVARALRDVAYGETLVSQGPLFTGATVEGGSIRCAFSNVSPAGLMAGSKTIVQNADSSYTINPVREVPGGTLTGFTIAGSDGNFVTANAVIDPATNTVVVFAAGVTAPLYVRYAYVNDPVCNLYNRITDANNNVVDGLPASPFRNDPVFRLNVVNGSGTNNYPANTAATVTAVSVSGLTFAYWSGDTALLARPDRSPTTATVTLPYATVGSNYTLNTAPTGLAATAGSQQVSLSWTALNNAIAYTVKRATASAGPYSTLATGLTGASYVDLAAGFNTTNYYVVSASNAVGEGPNSAPVTGVGQPPGPPANFAATAGNTVVALSWSPVLNAGSYTLARSTVNGGPYAPILTTASTSYVNDGLTNGVTYYYVVNANINGTAAPASAAISATPSASTTPVNRARGGTATGTGNGGNAAEGPASAFDGSLSTKWYGVQATVSSDNPVFLAYQFAGGAAWKVNSYQLGTANDSQSRDPRDWLFQGSNDGVNWTTLDSRANQTLGGTRSALTPAYTVNNPATYRNYRLLVTAVINAASGNGCQLSELALFSSPTDAGDKTAPTLTVPANLVTDATGPNGAVVNFTVTATDAVSGALTPVVQPPSGTVFPAGTTTVQCRATDDASNVATSSFTITVRGAVTDADLGGFVIVQNGTSSRITRPTSVAGRTYQLQRRIMLDAGTWANLGAPQSGGGPLDFTDPNPPQPQAFYRLVIAP